MKNEEIRCIDKLQKEDLKTLNSKLCTLNSYGKNFSKIV